MTRNVDATTLATELRKTWKPGYNLDLMAESLLEKYDVSEKPEPVGTIRRSGTSNTLYIKSTPDTWIGVYLNNGGHTEKLSAKNGPWGDTEVYRP